MEEEEKRTGEWHAKKYLVTRFALTRAQIFVLAENGLGDSDPLVRVQAISLLWLVVRIAPTATAPQAASKLPNKNEFDLVKHRGTHVAHRTC